MSGPFYAPDRNKLDFTFSNVMSLLRLLVLTVFCFRAGATEQPDWPWLNSIPIAQGLRGLSHITHAGDGSERLFAVQLAGQIRVINRAGQLLSQPFLDISKRIRPLEESEAGLWSVAFPPDFSRSRRYYVAYARVSDGAFTVSRFSVSSSSSNLTDHASEQIILTVPHPAGYHYGGQLAFGPDGFLYISCGDGLQSIEAQQLDSLYGKLLRIDPEGAIPGPSAYRIPPTNPFVSNPNARPEIWALGLRNPWRFSFDRATGDLYIGDVGERTREEVNLQPASSAGGANYGWPYWEGTFNPGFATLSPDVGPFVSPAFEYSRDEGSSVTGGFVYRGPSQPRLDGLYVYADFASGFVWGARRFGTSWHRESIAARNSLITTLGEDESGRLLMATLNGQVYRLEDSSVTPPPRFEPRGYESADGDVDGSVFTDRIRIVARSPGSVLRYTFELRTPTESDTLVPPDGIVVVTNGTRLSARAWQAGREPSEVQTSFFQLQTADPKFNPPPGAITNGTTVSISCDTPGAVIHFTVDDTEPNAESPIYLEPIRFSLEDLQRGAQVRAVAIRSGFFSGRFGGRFFLAQASAPYFTPLPGPIEDGTIVSILCDTPDAIIHFETNGTLATAESPVYTDSFVIDGGTQITAVATRNDLRISNLAAANYTRAWETNFGFLGFSQFLYAAGESNRSAVITVIRTGPTNLSAWVELTTSGLGASPGVDYTPTNGILHFPPGSTAQTFTINVIQDTLAEFTESLSIVLRNPTNAFAAQLNFANLHIADDDAAGTIEFSASKYNVVESQPAARVIIRRTGGFAGNVEARLHTAPLSATMGEDFIGTDTNFFFEAGETQKTIEIPLRDDFVDELDESFAIYLVALNGGATVGARNSATVILRDNDPTSLIQFARKSVHVSETNGTVAYLITRVGDVSRQATVAVWPYGITATSNADFSAEASTLIFAPGERARDYVITLANDELAEEPETIELLLANPTGALLGATRSATLVIDDDEVPLLGSYRILGAIRSAGCAEPGRNLAVSVQGRLDITNQTGSNFEGRGLLLGTTAGGYTELTLTGTVNSAGQILGSLHWTDSSGAASTGTVVGVAKSGRLSLSFTNAPGLDSCRRRGELTGRGDLTPLNSVAPASLIGRTLIVAPSRTTGAFAGRQPYRIEFTSADRCTITSDSGQFTPFESRFVYDRTAARTANIWTGDNLGRGQRLSLSFTSSTEGSFSGRAAASSGSHSGRFQLSQ